MDEIILKERELKEKLVQEINKSQLPAIMLRPILKELIEQVEILEQQQYAIACQNKQKLKEQVENKSQEAEEKTESEEKEDG